MSHTTPSASAADLVSIVMPTYNHAEYIGAAIESVRTQTHCNWELIVIDNHSIDGTQDIVAEFNDPRIIYRRFNNQGIIAASRNRGIALATGSYVAFLDSDDVWLPEKLACQLRVMNSSPEVTMVATNGLYHPTPSGAVLRRRRMVLRWRNTPIRLAPLVRRSWLINSTVLLRRSTVERIGPLDEAPGLCRSEDYDYWLRVVASSDERGVWLSRPLVLYRVHPNNQRHNGDPSQVLDRELTRLRMAWSKLPKAHASLVEAADSYRCAYARRQRHQEQITEGAESITTMLRTQGLSHLDKAAILVHRALAVVAHRVITSPARHHAVAPRSTKASSHRSKRG